MTALLTWNGIPPQIIGSLTQKQRRLVISYADIDKIESYEDWQNKATMPSALYPFAETVAAVASSFTHWGATINNSRGWNKFGIHSSYLRTGGTTYPLDFNLHSDEENALLNLHNKDFLVLRFLCVSSSPAIFVDLTGKENMGTLLEKHHWINNNRIYRRHLLTLAQTEGQTVNPKPWDIILFDTVTPHNPIGVLRPGQRILQDAWIEINLPSNWRERVKTGDVPTLQPKAQALSPT